MMDIKHDKLREFFEKVKALSFWQRLFGWGSFKALSYDAYSEYSQLIADLERISKEAVGTGNAVNLLLKDKENLFSENTRLAGEMNLIKPKIDELNSVLTALKEENAGYKKVEDDRRASHDEKAATLNAALERVDKERALEIKAANDKVIAELEAKKKTWANHQDNVKNAMRLICQRLTIEYVDKPPFKGTPDNTIKICDEFVIFDAKSPATDDLSNFPTYIKAQTESAKKYANQDSVRKDIFLVVPLNTIEVLDQLVFNMADYNVYVVTLDVLEPLMISLKKIEEYEFLEDLSPEERDNICRVIGKFAHITKRRIQVDQFFESQFLQILTKCESDLPRDVLDKVVDYEKQEKLNPPIEKRAKQILSKELTADSKKIRKEAEAKSIAFPEGMEQNIKSLPLYTEEPQ
ncbi:MAG: hypothetical protein NT099_06880 [Candidatus Saganbacteria bacterium]|nr:hypothetical protein [Candidatus Saganbacteria bacterium]